MEPSFSTFIILVVAFFYSNLLSLAHEPLSMDVITLIVLLIIVILLINNKIDFTRKLVEIEFRMTELQHLLKKQDQERTMSETSWKLFTDPGTVKPAPEVKLPEPPKPVEPRPKVVIEQHKEVITDQSSQLRKPIKEWRPPVFSKKEEQKSFFERYPDLEKFIGENLVNKIGIAILVLAIAFFVKYAIDNNWVGPVGRVGIGMLCGAILVGFAHRLRNNYKAFSSVLVGGGLAIFYFTITLAFQQFHLFTQPIALGILAVITIFAVTLSLLYNKQELAVIALIGGFASPFMVSNGSANYNGLFIYLLILNIGLLIIAWYKSWRVLNVSAFVLFTAVFTTVLFSLTSGTYVIGFRFATIFYLLFFTINIINNLRENKRFLAIDFSILLTNTALYFAAGLYLLTSMNAGEYRGLFSAALAALNLLLSLIMLRTRKVDPNILFLLIGITLTFLSLTAPIQLHGNNITLFWASEMVLLYWLYQKSSIKLLKLTSLIIWMAMLISLFLDLQSVYADHALRLTIIANRGFITTLYAAISSYMLYILVKKDPSAEIYGMTVTANIYKIAALILLFLSGLLEINHQFLFYSPDTKVNIIYIMLYVPSFVYLLNRIGDTINDALCSWRLGIILLASAIAVYLIFTPSYFDLMGDLLEHQKITTSHFLAHWISDLVIAAIFYKLINLLRDKFDDSKKNTLAWVLAAVIVLFLSTELCLICDLLFYSKNNSIDLIHTVYIKTGLPILWGLSSFIFMWIGMRNKQRTLRIISLTLFTVTLIKLFLFDINNIPVAGKIAAFFCLGILLLIISFMYQKVKKIIVDDEAEPKD